MCAILLVEDHYDTRQAFAAILRAWGHNVGATESATAGLHFLDANPVDVVVSDIGLPDRNGYEFVAEARSRHPRLATIAVSAYFTVADRDRVHEAGFDMYFAKPIDLRALRHALERIDSSTRRNGHESVNGAG
jgi:two-component system CheB/CheR fusion protein